MCPRRPRQRTWSKVSGREPSSAADSSSPASISLRLRGRTRITTSIFLSVVPSPPTSDDDDDVWRRIDRGVRPRRGDGDGGSLARVARCRRESDDSELLRCCCVDDLGFGVASRGGLADDERVGVRGGPAARRRGVRGGGGNIDITAREQRPLLSETFKFTL